MALDYGNGGGISVRMEGPIGGTGSIIKTTEVFIPANAWKGAESPYSQAVTVNAVSVNSIVNLQPNADQIVMLCTSGIALATENDNGNVTIHAFGNKPETDMLIQATVKEVVR